MRAPLLLLPATIFLGFFYAYPLVDLLLTGVRDSSGWTLEYVRQATEDGIYLRVYAITVEIAAEVTVLTLVLGYPVAYLLASVRSRIGQALLVLVLLPFFTNGLVRMFAWMIMLGSSGVVPNSIAALGLDPPQLLFNRAGVLIGMTYALLPYMILTLYSVMRGLDERVMMAAYGLGAGGWNVFWRIHFPLTLPGTLGGCLLVFILSLGFFITPALMGGPRDQTIAAIIVSEIELTVRWNFAAALSILLLVVTLLGFAVASRLTRLGARFEAAQ